MGLWEPKERSALGGHKAGRILNAEAGMPKEIAKALKRTRTMAVGDCISWADASLSSIGRNLLDHSRDTVGHGDYLRAARQDAAALYACLLAAEERLPPAPKNQPKPTSNMGAAAHYQG